MEKRQMIDTPRAHYDRDVPEYDEKLKCIEHPHGVVLTGYGLIGGGIGPYTFCQSCGYVISKSLDLEMRDA